MIITNCLVLCGNEPYIIDKKIENIKKEVLFPEVNLLSSEELNPNVIEAIKAFPLAEEKRVVILHLQCKGEELISLIKESPATTLLVIVTKEIDKRSAFYKFAEKNGFIKECNKLTPTQLMKFTFEILNKNGCKITNAAYDLFLKRTNYFDDPEVNLYFIEHYLNQLIFTSKIITEKEILLVVPESSNEKVYMLTKSILSGCYEKAFTLVLNYINQEENIIGILSLLLRVFRLAFKAAIYDDKKAELGSLLGVPLYQFQDALSIPAENINSIIDIIQGAINGIKAGQCDANEMLIVSIGKVISVIEKQQKNKKYYT